MNKILLGAGALFLISKFGRKGSTTPATTATTVYNSNSNSGSSYGVRFGRVTARGVARGCDGMGCGHYGAGRGSRTHKGIDYTAIPSEKIYSPIAGKVSRYPFPYSGDRFYTGIEIIGEGQWDGYEVKLFYVYPEVAISSKVIKGQFIGRAQDITKKHGSAMTNHIHMEVRRDGQTIDFAGLI